MQPRANEETGGSAPQPGPASARLLSKGQVPGARVPVSEVAEQPTAVWKTALARPL